MLDVLIIVHVINTSNVLDLRGSKASFYQNIQIMNMYKNIYVNKIM